MPENESYTELLPPEGDERLGIRIFEILGEILQDKSDLGLPAKWTRNYELGKNKHWKSGHKKVSLVSANLLFAHRQRTVNMLTDNNPTFNVSRIGMQEGQEEVYNSMLHTAEHWWIEQEQQNVLERSVINGETYGCTIEKSIFNTELEIGLGEAETEVIDPFNFGFYPVKCRDIQKADANLHFKSMPVREAKRRWPEYADQIKADTQMLEELGDTRREVQGGRPSQPTGYFSTIAGIVKNMLNIATDAKGEAQECLVVECWVKDYSTVKDKDGGTSPKYKGHIRCVTTCNAGTLVLSDRDNPSINENLPLEQAQKTYLFDKFPFSFTHSVTDTSNPWGMSDYEQLEGLQIEVDKTISQFTLIKDKLSRIKIINPKDSGVHNREFTNAPGIVNPSNSLVAAGIRYMDPPAMPTDLANALQIYKDYFFLVAGTFELESAQVPGREVIAYKAIAALLERATTMLRGKIRNYSKMMRERGRMYISQAQNWYTEDRWITYEDDGEELTKTVRGEELIIPGKLTVVSGSTMPVSRVQEREEAISLYDKGAIDNQELLKKLDWSGWKDVIKRLQAGPVGDLIEKMAAMGVPDPILQVFQQMAQVDLKDVEKGLEKGEIPMFMQLIEALMGGGEPEGPTPEDMEAGKTQAEINKINAEIDLIKEKAITERVLQYVKSSGVNFDEEKLKIERARIIADMDGKRREEIISEETEIQGRTEKGLKSNNKNKE